MTHEDEYVGMYDLEESITTALKNKTIIPKAILNIKLDFKEIEKVLLSLFKDDEDISPEDLLECKKILLANTKHGICRLLLVNGLYLKPTLNFVESFANNLFIWIENSAENNKFMPLLKEKNDDYKLKLENSLLNLFEKIKLSVESLFPETLEIDDFFTYENNKMLDTGTTVMYKTISDEVLCLLRF